MGEKEQRSQFKYENLKKKRFLPFPQVVAFPDFSLDIIALFF